LLVNTLKDAVVIPDDAVQHGINGLYVFAVDQNNKAELQQVSIGASTNGRTVIEKGLTPGQKVIVSGQYRIQPGSVVTTTVADSGQAPAKAR
jgi:multidrug efflux system membrane fusion protein